MKKIVICICLAFISIILVVYISYFKSYEGRNQKENLNASKLYHLYSSALLSTDIDKINNDMILSSNPKLEYGNNLSSDFYNVLSKYAADNNVNINDGIYYIEIRDKNVYKVIYAKWKYSGFVGMSPEPNGKCSIYINEVDKEKKEFLKYLQK